MRQDLGGHEYSRAARVAEDRTWGRELLKSKVQLRAASERVAGELVREGEDGFNRKTLRPAIRVIKRVSSMPAPAVITLLMGDGMVVVGHEGYRNT